MKKSDWYKIGAIVIVVAFVVEAIAIGIMGNNSNSDSNVVVAKTDLSGTSVANVTIARYEPYLVVTGNKSGIEAAKQALIERGDATYAIASGESVIVNLKNSKVVPSAAAEFEKVNATPYATAIITLPSNIRLQGDGMATTVSAGLSFTMRIRPIYDEGETVAASFSANIQKGQMVSIGSFTFIPNEIRGAHVNATLTGAPRQSYSILVPWEKRSGAKGIAIAQNATYMERSFILIPQNASEQQLSALILGGKAFVTDAQAGTGIVSVRNGFVDATAANLTISATGLSPIFPPSVASVVESWNESASERAQGLLLALNQSGIYATLVEKNAFAVNLPENFEWAGKTYISNGITIPLELSGASNYTNGSVVGLALDFEAMGKRVSRITDAKEAANAE